MPSNQKKKKSLAHIVEYCRSAGIVSLAIAVVGLMQGPEYFWLSVGLVYFALVVWSLDVFFEPWPRPWMRWPALGFVALLAVLVSWLWVFVSAPLGVSSVAVAAEYPAGTSIGGIKWRPEFTETQVRIANPSARTYSDIDLVVTVDFPVAAISQLSTVPDVSFENALAMSITQMVIDESNGNRRANPLVLLATDAGYRIRCGRLLPKSTLHLVLAVADVRWNPEAWKPRPDGGIFEKDYVLRLKMSGGKTFWYGHNDAANAYTPRPTPQKITVTGEYTAAQRRRVVDMSLLVVLPDLELQRALGKKPTMKPAP
jgi:hypothetical protein